MANYNYYGRMHAIDSFTMQKRGVHNFMLEEMIANTLQRIENNIYIEIRESLSDLRKDIENEIKKQGDNIRVLMKFKEFLEEEQQKPKKNKKFLKKKKKDV